MQLDTSTNDIKLSPFWKTRDFNEGEFVMLRRLGPTCPGEYRGVIRGVYACDVFGHPDAYIVEILDKMPEQKYTCSVFPRGCVDEFKL